MLISLSLTFEIILIDIHLYLFQFKMQSSVAYNESHVRNWKCNSVSEFFSLKYKVLVFSPHIGNKEEKAINSDQRVGIIGKHQCLKVKFTYLFVFKLLFFFGGACLF